MDAFGSPPQRARPAGDGRARSGGRLAASRGRAHHRRPTARSGRPLPVTRLHARSSIWMATTRRSATCRSRRAARCRRGACRSPDRRDDQRHEVGGRDPAATASSTPAKSGPVPAPAGRAPSPEQVDRVERLDRRELVRRARRTARAAGGPAARATRGPPHPTGSSRRASRVRRAAGPRRAPPQPNRPVARAPASSPPAAPARAPRTVRRCVARLAEATCASASRMFSRASARGIAWKLPPETIRPVPTSTSGLSDRAASSRSISVGRRVPIASRSAPWICGTVRNAIGSCTVTLRSDAVERAAVEGGPDRRRPTRADRRRPGHPRSPR